MSASRFRIAVRTAIAATCLAAGTAHAQKCPGDCDGNGQLNILDFVCFQQQWQQQTDFGDCDGNGAYNILDFVCFQQAFQSGCPLPEIDDVFPTKGGPGTIVNVVGKNLDAFSDDPRDLCFVAGHTGFQVVRVLPDLIQAVALPQGDDVAGEIFIAFGKGNFEVLDFPSEEGDLADPVWCWGQPPNGPVAAAGFIFEPVPDVLPTDVFPSQLVNGDLVINLNGADWNEGDKIRIIARAWCDLRHIDCVLPTFRLKSNATPNQCALAICSLITAAYQQLGITIDCFVGAGPTITISYPDCDIQPGISLTSLVERTPCAAGQVGDVSVGNIEPNGGSEGDIISVEVKGLLSPTLTCIHVLTGCPIDPLLLIGNRLIARLGPVPPGAVPGPIIVARGEGTLIPPEDVQLPGILATEIGDGFQGFAGFGNDQIFDGPFFPGEETPNTQAFKFSDGQIVVTLNDDWKTGDKIRIDVHFDAKTPNGTKHFDCFAQELCLTAPNPDVNSCATLLCALIQQCFAAQNPPVNIQCNTIGGTIVITAPAIGEITGGGGTVSRH